MSKLKLMTNATANEALAANINDAMVFGPFLIVNGKPLEIVGDPWGYAPRVAIGQTKSGIIIFLVVVLSVFLKNRLILRSIMVIHIFLVIKQALLQ